MWAVVVAVAIVGGGVQQQVIGKQRFASEAECVEKFDENLKSTALRSTGFIAKLDSGHTLKSITFKCAQV